MTNYVVTGGAGFIGSHLSEALAQNPDHTVRVFDNLITGRATNVSHTVQLVYADLTTRIPDLSGVDTVFHQAALPSVPRSVEHPLESHRANVDGTLQVLLACRDDKVQRVIYASSSSVYGDCIYPSVKKEELLPAPISPYATQKYTGEVYMHAFWRTYGLETVSLRYFNVYGPGQTSGAPYGGVVPRFVMAGLRNEAPTIYGDGNQIRDFTWVGDVVRANLKAAEAPRECAGQVFNIAGGVPVSINELWEIISSLTGTTRTPLHVVERAGDIRDSRADISRARHVLGWEPETGPEDGLKQTVSDYRQRIAPGFSA